LAVPGDSLTLADPTTLITSGRVYVSELPLMPTMS
jgi:hypothetical protein